MRSRIIIILLFICGIAYADSGLGGRGGLGTPPAYIMEEDGSPSGIFTRLVVENDTLAFSASHAHYSANKVNDARYLLLDGSNADDTTGDWEFFKNLSIGNDADGKYYRFYRFAPEATDYFEIKIDAATALYLTSTAVATYFINTGGYFDFLQNVYVGRFSNGNPFLTVFGVIDALGEKGASLQVNDATNDAEFNVEAGINRFNFLAALSATSTVDFGSATSLEVPNIAGDVVCDAAGEIAVDSTNKQLVVFDSVEVAIPLRHMIYGPLYLTGAYDIETDYPILELDSTVYPNGIVITGWSISSTNADPTTELNANLTYCDDPTTGAFPGANPVLIDVMDTTSTTGNASETTMANSDLGSGIIPTAKVIYIDMDADPTDTDTFWILKIEYYIPES